MTCLDMSIHDSFLKKFTVITLCLLAEVIENPDDHHSLHPLHPLSLALHCTLILSKCSSHVRNELGQNGGLWQLVKNLRSLQMIPGWTGVSLFCLITVF